MIAQPIAAVSGALEALLPVFFYITAAVCCDAFGPFAAPQKLLVAQERFGVRLSPPPSAWAQCRGGLWPFSA